MATGSGPGRRDTHNVIIVGAGSAGCLLAGRLASETQARVLLLEYGGRDTTPLVHIPSGFSKLLQYGRFLYPYMTVPQTQLDGRPRALQQGWGLGGGSSINAMAYVRGQPRDYARWQEAVGDEVGWSWDDLLPHFKGMEGSDVFSEPWHGSDGPLKVSEVPLSPLNRAVVKAFQEIGIPQSRLQWREPNRRRPVPADHRQCPPVQFGGRVPPSRRGACESDGPHRRACH
jgi:choline dehydrogenase-like flavoprotein